MLSCLWAGGGPAWSANLLPQVRDQEIKQVLRLRVGGSKVIKTPFAVTRVSVANPEIADIVLISDREIYLNGLGIGVTNLTLWGRGRFTSTTITVEADLSLLKEKLAKILPKEKIGVESAGDSIVLSGEVSSPTAQQTALDLAAGFLREQALKEQPTGESPQVEIKAGAGGASSPSESKAGGQKRGLEMKIVNLMHVGGVQQVMMEVRIAEIQRDVGRRIGINFSGVSPQGNFGVSQLGSLTNVSELQRLIGVFPDTVRPFGSLPTSWTQGIGTGVTALGGFMSGGVLWTMFFDVLKSQGLGRILAEPNLVSTSGQQATFWAGGEFPIPVPQAFGTVTIEYKKFGILLGFTPTVLDDGKLAVKVSPEFSELDFTTSPVVIAGLVIPGLRTRQVVTHVELKDGQTFAIAGLISDTHRNVVNKFPVLGNIPILGAVFRSSQYQKNETELVVLVTPRLVKPITSTAAVRLPTDRFIEPNDVEAYLFGALEGREKKKRPVPPPLPSLPEGFGHKPVQQPGG
jgi:pilus assembly protein CpaC